MPLYIHFSFTRRIFHLLLVTKVRLFEKPSVRRENLGTRLLSGSSLGWFHYLFVWNKIYVFLTHKPSYFMKKSIAFDRVFDRVLEKRETSPLKARARNASANRPFYRYGGHIELVRFKEYYRMPRGHEHISFVFSSAFRDIFS